MSEWALRASGRAALINLDTGNQIRVLDDEGSYRVVLTIGVGSSNTDLVPAKATEAEAISEVLRLGAQLGYIS